jgi:hypothetical protein
MGGIQVYIFIEVILIFMCLPFLSVSVLLFSASEPVYVTLRVNVMSL